MLHWSSERIEFSDSEDSEDEVRRSCSIGHQSHWVDRLINPLKNDTKHLIFGKVTRRSSVIVLYVYESTVLRLFELANALP